MGFSDTIEFVSKVVDATGVAVIALGVVTAAIMTVRDREGTATERYRRLRQRVGKAILLGLELLVAADIIRTVALEPTFENAAVLGIVVLIRIALSISLEVELEGAWPWARRRTEARLHGAEPG
jgi:uncharacterized membrane protein